MLLVLIGIATLVVLLYMYLVRCSNYWSNKGVPQGKTVPLFGDMWKVLLRKQCFAEMVQEVYYKCPGTRYSGTCIFFLPLLVIKDLELIKQITVKDFDHFTDHIQILPPDIDPLWSKNLFSLAGKKWREMRNILSPSFTSSKMKSMFLLMNECAENFVQHFLKKDETVITLEMKSVFTRFTNDMIASTAFGLKVDSLAEPNNEFYTRGKEASTVTSFKKSMQSILSAVCPQLVKALKIKFFSDEVVTFFRGIIDDTITLREEEGIVRPDMIHLLMEARKGIQKQDEGDVIDTGFATAHEDKTVEVKGKPTVYLTNEDITAQALIFFFAGFDTVASLMSFTSYELAVNQDVQNKLRKEILETDEECNGNLTYDALMKMKYLDTVISETLRKWPTNVALDRVCTKPYIITPVTPEEKPVHLEKNMVVWLPVFAIHRDPKFYPDPERFDPDRFNEENKEKIKPYTYFPFGLGPRNCIGSRFALLETKTVLYHILLHFEIVPVEKTTIPLKISKKSFLLNSEDGFWLGLKRISE